MKKRLRRLPHIFKSIAKSSSLGTWRLIGLCAIVGLMAGFGSIAFHLMLDGSRFLFLEKLGGWHPGGPAFEETIWTAPEVPFRPWVILLLPVLGTMFSTIVCRFLAPETAGHGTDAAIAAYHHHGGFVRKRVPIIKAITAAVTIGSGGSAGAEGPITQIGAGFGSMLAGWLKLNPSERRILMAAGMSAGVGAIFHAPLAGALFAAEVFYRELDLEFEVIIPAVISSTVAYATFASCFGWDPLFSTGNYAFTNPLELLPYLILALVVSFGAIFYVKVFDSICRFFKKSALPFLVKPLIGGLIIGAIGLLLPETLGTSYGVLQSIFAGKATLTLLLGVAFLKIFSTSLTIGSGGSGGVFGPAMVIGGSLGGAAGMLLALLFPDMNLNPGAFAIVGMAGFFSATANTPISTIILVSEMTGNYHLLVPAMLVCFLGYLLTKRLTIYGSQLPNRFEAPLHIGEMLKAVLHKIPVAQLLGNKKTEDFPVVKENTPLWEMSQLLSNQPYHSFPVVDSHNELVGVVDDKELRMSIGQHELDHLLVAGDLARRPVFVTPNSDLYTAVSKMSASQLDELIVVSAHNHDQFKAIISNRDIINAYHETLLEEASAGGGSKLN